MTKPGRDGGFSRRQEYLRRLIPLLKPEISGKSRVTPLDTTWQDWLKRTGELPPDFDAMPTIPFQPDPLVLDEGGKNIRVKTRKQWEEKREWIRGEIKYWITGSFPPPPLIIKAEILDEKNEGAVTLRTVLLKFGPQNKAGLTLELMIPPGKKPFPVFMTQWTHRNWAAAALRRGYLGCVYAASDNKDDADAYAGIWYPEYDFSLLMRRAWAASRAVDYLCGLEFVDRKRIALTGHSRNGKQSLLAAAFDERITAVISSSGGTGSEIPFRYTGNKYNNESIEGMTTDFPHWFHPRLRFFQGREDKLPIDQNLLMTLIAPRALMCCSAVTEEQGNPWGIEQGYRSVKRVYKFLKAEDRLSVLFRQGRHSLSAGIVEQYIDFFDYAFKRSPYKPPQSFYHDYSFENWMKKSGERVVPESFPVKGTTIPASACRSVRKWEQEKREIQSRVTWIMGESPQAAANRFPGKLAAIGHWDEYPGDVIGRPQETQDMARVVIGQHCYGSLYYPKNAGGSPARNIPAVIFLHGYSYATGFALRSGFLFENLVKRGFAVYAFDMIGFGARIEEGARFYSRYPRWSKLGKMAEDTKNAVSLLANFDFIDPGKIYLCGYTLGGAVGLHAAALDKRIAGVAAVCAFTPMRADGGNKVTEGARAYSYLHGLLPRLGFFTGRENRIPYDFHELLACIAPRKLLVVAPSLDRDAVSGDVEKAMGEAGKIYGLYNAPGEITFKKPEDFNRFSEPVQQEIIQWLVEKAVKK